MATVISSLAASPATAKGTSERLHLDFLDGLRGLAALYVALYHLVGEHQSDYIRVTFLTGWMQFGHFAVGIFIVLSGYCLMLPVARSAEGTLRGGAFAYLKRRAWRIIPPYYIALAATLLLIAVTQFIKHSGPQAGNGWGVFAPADLVLHLTLLHNLSLQWCQAIDPPMWSVGLEWQIYFLFPLFLLPIWRRAGGISTLIIATAVSVAPHFLLPSSHNLDYLYLWYVGLFAFGMAGAAIGFSERPLDRPWRNRVPWGTTAALFGIAFTLIVGHPTNATTTSTCIADLLIGLTTMCLIIYCAQTAKAGGRSRLVALLSSRPCVKLGHFSYSLYLIHLPAYWLIQPVFRALHLHGIKAILFQSLIGIPFVIGIAYLFFLAFERRFLSPPGKKSSDDAPPAIR